MRPRADSIGYQKQKYGAHTESDSKVVKDEHVNKEYSDETHSRIKKAHQIADRTLIIISQEIVDQLRIDEETWFQQDIVGDEIHLKILGLNEKWRYDYIDGIRYQYSHHTRQPEHPWRKKA